MPCTSKNPDGRFRHGYGSPQFRLFLLPLVFSSLHVLVRPIGGGASLKEKQTRATLGRVLAMETSSFAVLFPGGPGLEKMSSRRDLIRACWPSFLQTCPRKGIKST